MNNANWPANVLVKQVALSPLALTCKMIGLNASHYMSEENTSWGFVLFEKSSDLAPIGIP